MVDASAIAAILLKEDGARELSARLDDASGPVTHAVSIYEAALALSRRKGLPPVVAQREVEKFLQLARIEVTVLTRAEAAAALDAHARYGRGRGHPARLNMGDCFSYACARLRGLPLLYKGEDFAQTDLA